MKQVDKQRAEREYLACAATMPLADDGPTVSNPR